MYEDLKRVMHSRAEFYYCRVSNTVLWRGWSTSQHPRRTRLFEISFGASRGETFAPRDDF